MNRGMQVRVVILRVLVVSLLITLGARLWVLQVLDDARYREAAETNRVRDVITSATRGMILDDQGRPLVRNRTSLVISVNRSTTDRQADKGRAVLERLAGVLGVPADEIAKRIRFCSAKVPPPCWNGTPYQPVPVAKDVTAAQALSIIEHPDRYPGVSADLQAVREYPNGGLAAHELGYLAPVTSEQVERHGKDRGFHANSLVGVAGLEYSYDTDLRGSDGVQRLEVDRFGRVAGTASTSPPLSGNHLVLGLDVHVQQAVEQTLRETLDSLGGGPRSASAVVLDVRTGRVVAMASLPSYDPSVFVGGISEADYQALTDEANGTPLLSRAYQGSSAPASTFKTVSTAVAIENMGATFDGNYECSPTLQVGGQTFHNFGGSSAGMITLRQALVISCDVIFDRFAYEGWLADGGLRNGRGPYSEPNEHFARMAEAMGFGRPTGIDLPGEAAGAVVDREDARRIWEELKDSYCRRAQQGYPEEPDPVKAERFRQYAAEACVDGYLYNGGAAVQFSIGQGQYLSVSPLQLATSYAAIANGGTLYEPRLAKAVISPDGELVRTIEPVAAGTLPIRPETLDYIRNALVGVTREGGGTASGVFADWPHDAIPVAGKTGTAEVEGKGDTSWFASFAPANDPQFAVVVTIPESGTGSEFAAPAAKKIYQAIYGVGREAALPGGKPPEELPKVNDDGSVSVSGTPAAPAVPPAVPPGAPAVPPGAPENPENPAPPADERAGLAEVAPPAPAPASAGPAPAGVAVDGAGRAGAAEPAESSAGGAAAHGALIRGPPPHARQRSSMSPMVRRYGL